MKGLVGARLHPPPLPSSLEEPFIEGLDLDGVAREYPDAMSDHQLGQSIAIDQDDVEA